MRRRLPAALILTLAVAAAGRAAALPCGEFKVYQFPADAIPRIDGKADDWAQVGAAYTIRTDQLAADDGSGRRPAAGNLSISLKVGWVKGENRLYFLYEADDDYWDFADPGLHNDILELVVDGDRSGGPLIARFHPELASRPGASAAAPGALSDQDAWFGFQNVQAQNYHIFTPAKDKDWAMAWGPQAAWIKRLPWSNAAYSYAFRPGEPGHLTLEFWITPFDYAAPEGPERSVETRLTENGVIAMAVAVIDRDGPNEPKGQFWNLSPRHTMYGQASDLCAFRLMPPEPASLTIPQADWSFAILDKPGRVVAFHDDSRGPVTAWRWDFGDGQSSAEPNPIHRYARPGKYVVILDVEGPAGHARLSKVWDVSFTADPPK
jgi:hypothetical protein